MTATATTKEATGAGPTWYTVSNARFATSDTHTPSTNYPIPVPSTGTNRSYWKSHALSFTGTFSEITDVVFYTDGGGWTDNDGTTWIGDSSIAEGSYDQAVGNEGTTGSEITVHSGIGSKSDLFGYTSASPFTVQTGPITSTGLTNHVVLQMDVGTAATQGVLANETMTWQYDEI